MEFAIKFRKPLLSWENQSMNRDEMCEGKSVMETTE